MHEGAGVLEMKFHEVKVIFFLKSASHVLKEIKTCLLPV